MMQKSVIGEPAYLSWARSLILATGIFFISVIFLGQIPSYFEVISASSAQFEQGLLNIGLLVLGLSIIGLVASFLYDPKPVSGIFLPFFFLLGAVFLAAGVFLLYQVYSGAWYPYLPDQLVSVTGSGATLSVHVTNWPNPGQSYLFNPVWFQPQSVNIPGVGFDFTITGGGILSYVLLYPLHAAGKITGQLKNLLVWGSAGVSAAILFAYLTLYTFSAAATTNTPANGAMENVLLGLALGLMLFALLVWLLPVMTDKQNRAKFMPANYLHAAMTLGNLAVPLLVLFVVWYPLINEILTIAPNNYFVQCSTQQIPSSCFFSANMQYVVAAVVSTTFMVFMIAGGYLWNRKPAFTRLGFVYAFVFAALAAVVSHTGDTAAHLPVAIVMGIGIALIGLLWTISTQREFVPPAADIAPLGCIGQWLVMGSLLFIYMAGFAFFSYAQFFDTAANLVVNQGAGAIHDAYWVLLIFTLFGAVQFAFLTKRQKIGTWRKAVLWITAIGVGVQITGAIDMNLSAGNLSDLTYFAGAAVAAAGVLIGIVGAIMTRKSGGMIHTISIAAFAFIGVAAAYFCYTVNIDELVVASTVLMTIGAFVYSIYGADPPALFTPKETKQPVASA